jgi:hypothetical protein
MGGNNRIGAMVSNGGLGLVDRLRTESKAADTAGPAFGLAPITARAGAVGAGLSKRKKPATPAPVATTAAPAAPATIGGGRTVLGGSY